MRGALVMFIHQIVRQSYPVHSEEPQILSMLVFIVVLVIIHRQNQDLQEGLLSFVPKIEAYCLEYRQKDPFLPLTFTH